jgi:hypothetical protein
MNHRLRSRKIFAFVGEGKQYYVPFHFTHSAVCFRPMPEVAHPSFLVVELAQRIELVRMDHDCSRLCRVSCLGYVMGSA